MPGATAKTRYRYEPIGWHHYIVAFAAILSGTAAGLWLLSSYVGANTSIPPGIAGLAATAVIVTPALLAILHIERARRRAQVARFQPMFVARGWNVAPAPTWPELECFFDAATITAWRSLGMPRPAYLADGQAGGLPSVVIGPGGHWVFPERDPQALPQRAFASQCPATMWVFLDRSLPGFLLTRRLDRLKPVELVPHGTRRRSRRRVAQILVLLLVALGFAALAVFSHTGASARIYGTAFSGVLASVAAAMAIAYARAAFLARRAATEPEAPAEGLAPDFADLFALAQSPGTWLPSASVQRWLMDRRDRFFRIHVEGLRVAIAVAPLPGSRPGYPQPLDEAALDDLLALAAELLQRLSEEPG